MQKVLKYFCLCLLSASISALIAQENNFIAKNGFEKNQISKVYQLNFDLPKNWQYDDFSTKENGLLAALVPQGSNLKNTDKVITISFQRKKPVEGLKDLKSYMRANFFYIVKNFEGTKVDAWAPSALHPSLSEYMGIKISGDKISHQRTIVIDAQDGFYSVAHTVADEQDFIDENISDFFRNISLEKK